MLIYGTLNKVYYKTVSREQKHGRVWPIPTHPSPAPRSLKKKRKTWETKSEQQVTETSYFKTNAQLPREHGRRGERTV